MLTYRFRHWQFSKHLVGWTWKKELVAGPPRVVVERIERAPGQRQFWKSCSWAFTATSPPSALYPLAFGTFFNALLTYFGVGATTWTGIAGGVAAVLITAYMIQHNIRLGATIIGVLMVLEATFVAVLALVIVIKGGVLGHFSAAPGI